jgi:hypothetical protein
MWWWFGCCKAPRERAGGNDNRPGSGSSAADGGANRTAHLDARYRASNRSGYRAVAIGEGDSRQGDHGQS